MPPKGTPKSNAAAAAKKTPQSAKGGRANAKKKEVDSEEEEDEELMMAQAKAASKKKTPAKKPSSEGDEDEEDLDEEEEFDEEEDEEEELDEDEEDEEDEEEEEEESGKPKKTLFIKNLPMVTTEAQIKALSPDIQSVRLEQSKKSGEPNPKYAVIDFADEQTATKNLEQLKGTKVNGADIVVDYVGAQSIVTFVTPALTPSSDPLKLYVTGFGRDITIEQLKDMFPTSKEISLPLNPKDNNKPIGYAFIHYVEEDVCRKAHDSSQELSYQNRTLVVMYGKKTLPAAAAPAETKRKQPAKRGPKPKKAKQESEEEEEEEEYDEDADN